MYAPAHAHTNAQGVRIISSGSMGALNGPSARTARTEPRSSEAGRSFYLFEAAALALYEACLSLSPHDLVHSITRMYVRLWCVWKAHTIARRLAVVGAMND